MDQNNSENRLTTNEHTLFSRDSTWALAFYPSGAVVIVIVIVVVIGIVILGFNCWDCSYDHCCMRMSRRRMLRKTLCGRCFTGS